MLTIRFRVARASLALSLVLGLSLCASQAAAQVRTPTHVACVGDSITYGYMASSASASYPSVLQKLFGSSVKVMNYGHNSATMLSVGDLPYQTLSEYTAATTFVSGAGTTAVVDVIIMLGTNDSKSYNWMSGTSTRAQQFVTDCGAMVDHFASLSTHPLVYLALPPRAFANTYGISGTIIHDQILPLIQQVAAAKGVPIIDVDTPTASHSELFPDGVHPNDTGYALVAQVMHDGLLAPRGTGGQGGQAARAAQRDEAELRARVGKPGKLGKAARAGQAGQSGHGGQGGKAGSSGDRRQRRSCRRPAGRGQRDGRCVRRAAVAGAPEKQAKVAEDGNAGILGQRAEPRPAAAGGSSGGSSGASTGGAGDGDRWQPDRRRCGHRRYQRERLFVQR